MASFPTLSSPAPVSATVIAELEAQRRDANRDLGLCQSGCSEVDDYVLLGGLERGSVVGISCENERFGVTLAIQILSRGLCTGRIGSAHVITPRPQTEILTVMRDGIIAQLGTDGQGGDSRAVARGHLERVMLSCVFDMEGVWEVIAGLDRQPSPEVPAEKEIKDSQDDDDDDDYDDDYDDDAGKSGATQKAGPGVVVITHFGSLMTGLFTHRSSSSAHETAQKLSSHLRHLSRSMPSSPLILLLNSTASSSASGGGGGGEQSNAESLSSGSAAMRSSSSRNKPLDPMLRSIFNPPFLPDYGQAHGAGAQAAAAALSRRNKPTFGLIFSHFLDIHILCTRVPRTDADSADAAFGAEPAAGANAEYSTVVEVLLDETGVWPAAVDRQSEQQAGRRIGQQGRRYREQRWGAVTVRDGKVVDAFEKDTAGAQRTDVNVGRIRVVAGFGGPRV